METQRSHVQLLALSLVRSSESLHRQEHTLVGKKKVGP
jgi:hypothetical protein